MKARRLLEKIYGERNTWLAAAERSPEPPDWTDPAELFAGLAQLGPVRDYLEVGSWLGGSAIKAGVAFPDAESIVCVDTWLGAAEHWIDRENPTHDLLLDEEGQPRLYEAFLRNVLCGVTDHERVAPVRMPSTIAAEVLWYLEYRADVIYIDASHSYADVLADCRAWWPLTRRWLVGDDWGDPRFGVAAAVMDFMRVEKIDPRKLQLFGGVFWVLER